jgi:hypothetical protein
MTKQTFPTGEEPKVILAQVNGDLNVRGWDQRTLEVEIDGRVGQLYQEGDALMITDCDSDIDLRVPFNTDIQVTSLSGDVTIDSVRRVELKDIGGDVELEDIGADVDLENIGETVALTNIAADLNVTNTAGLRSRDGIGGDTSLTNVALAEIESVGAELSVEHAETVVVSTVGGDLDASDIAHALRCGNIGGDFELQDSADAEVTVGNVGGDAELGGAANVQMGSVGGDCELRDVQGAVEMGNVGGDASIVGVGGNLQVGSIGGDAQLERLQGAVEVGSVGGDLDLQAAFPAGSHTRLNIGGDASVVLPDNPHLSIRAAVGGDVSGQSIAFGGGGNLVSLVYGEGAAQLEMSVGGDLDLNGGGSPRSSSASGSWNDFGREMAELGREMGRLGQELGREISSVFKEAGWVWGASRADEIGRKVEEKVRKAQRRAEERARHAEEKARHASERSRMRVRFNEREWKLDPQRLDRIIEQAQRAADEGVAGALEAVERAVSKLRVPRPPVPPTPPPSAPPGSTPPMPPEPPTSPASPTPGSPVGSETQAVTPGQEIQGEQPAQQSRGGVSEPNLEQEREAILRMIAEGRISPEEGDLLLEGLGS